VRRAGWLACQPAGCTAAESRRCTVLSVAADAAVDAVAAVAVVEKNWGCREEELRRRGERESRGGGAEGGKGSIQCGGKLTGRLPRPSLAATAAAALGGAAAESACRARLPRALPGLPGCCWLHLGAGAAAGLLLCLGRCLGDLDGGAAAGGLHNRGGHQGKAGTAGGVVRCHMRR
jgi:hypothetical protein